MTLVVAGATGRVADLGSQLEGIRERVAEGERLKDVCADVAAATGLSKKALTTPRWRGPAAEPTRRHTGW